jgi:hypothetical protein
MIGEVLKLYASVNAALGTPKFKNAHDAYAKSWGRLSLEDQGEVCYLIDKFRLHGIKEINDYDLVRLGC